VSAPERTIAVDSAAVPRGPRGSLRRILPKQYSCTLTRIAGPSAPQRAVPASQAVRESGYALTGTR